MKKVLVLVVATVSLLACNSGKNSESSTLNGKDTVEVSPAPRAIHIRHVSFGGGIDRDADLSIREIIASEIIARTVVVFQSRPMQGAMEGETEMCVEFSSADDMFRVLDLVKPIDDESNRVSIGQASACKLSL